MYESPINQILGEMKIEYENECMKVVQSCGFDVNKEELTKALAYDRNQYEKGYADAKNEIATKIYDAVTDKFISLQTDLDVNQAIQNVILDFMYE